MSLAAIRGKYFTAVATQGLLALLGAYLEQRTTGQADDLLHHLLRLIPKAWVERDVVLAQIPCSQLQVGDHIAIGPDQMIPIDSKVIGGNTAVNLIDIGHDRRSLSAQVTKTPVIQAAQLDMNRHNNSNNPAAPVAAIM